MTYIIDGKENRAGLSRGIGEEFNSYLRRLDEYIQRLEWNSEGHRSWYTHKNPSGCWICDIQFLVRYIRDETLAQLEASERPKPTKRKSKRNNINKSKSEEL